MLATKPLIAIDIDDTIAASTESIRLLANKKTGASLSPEAYQAKGEYWGYYERVWEANDLGGQVHYSDFEKEMVVDQSQVPLLPSAGFAVAELSKRYDIVLITARDKTWEEATRRWLTENFPGRTIDVHFTAAHKDERSMTKGQLCRHLGATVLIDDNVEHCQSALDEGIEAILFGQYGWQHAAPRGMRRCLDWPAVLEYLANA